VILHSLGSGNESIAAEFPFEATSSAWLPDGSVMAYTAHPNPDDPSLQVWLYSQRRFDLVYTYRLGIGDCICRFGLPPQVLSISPDGQYLVSGWIAGKGSEPLAVYRVSDRARVATLTSDVYGAFWTRSGHGLFLIRFGAPSQVWTPEQGVTSLPGAASFSVLPGPSPDGNVIAYTAYPDPNNQVNPRVWTYDLKAGTTRMLVDKSRTQVIFVKDGWVWYLDEVACTSNCAGGSMPSGKVYAMNLSSGVEQQVSFAAGEHPFTQGGYADWFVFAPGEFWPVN
jgi:Tol biopolymer transport system component